jgi:hypothetical protein
MANEYILHYTKDALKAPLHIHPRTIDRASSSIILVGKGVQNYGDEIQESLLHILEHFCSDISPTAPTEGQLWYDSHNKIIKVCTGFLYNSSIPPNNIADPNDPHYLRDINGIRVPKWSNLVGSNGLGNKTISTNPPSGGVDGDIWYQV